MSDVSTFDQQFLAVANTFGNLSNAVAPFVQRRRQTQFVEAVTQARRRTQEFQTSLRDREDWEGYETEWDQAQQNIAAEIAEQYNDHAVRQEFYNWWAQHQETARQKVGEIAWNREFAHGIASLEDGLQAAHELTDYGERREQLQFVVRNAQSSGYIDELEASRILDQNYERIFMDQLNDSLNEIYADGGYDQALTWINGDNGANEAQRSDLITQLNRLDAQAQRRFRERQQQSVNTLYEGIYSGDTTVRGILSDPYIDANQQDWLIGKLQQLTQAEQEVGEGETTEEGKNIVANLQTDLDRGRDRIEVMDEADQAYQRGEISRTEWEALRGYEALGEFEPYWNDLEDTIKELELPMAQTMAEARRRLQGVLFIKSGPNTWRRNTEVSEKEIQQYFQNVERELAGDRIMQQASRRDYRRGENQFGQRIGLADPYNTAEDNLRAIDQGQLLGYRDDEQYGEWLNEMSFEHKRMFEEVPFAETVTWAGFDRDGRPVFTAMTPVGRRAVAWFMMDPNTKEEFEDEQPYYWDRELQQWRVLPQDAITDESRLGEQRDLSASGGYDPVTGTARPSR